MREEKNAKELRNGNKIENYETIIQCIFFLFSEIGICVHMDAFIHNFVNN